MSRNVKKNILEQPPKRFYAPGRVVVTNRLMELLAETGIQYRDLATACQKSQPELRAKSDLVIRKLWNEFSTHPFFHVTEFRAFLNIRYAQYQRALYEVQVKRTLR